jgi:ubiquinone/menaquinone biosynthesis C-methylase UbiE
MVRDYPARRPRGETLTPGIFMAKVVDYDNIASRYDLNPVRSRVDKDPCINALAGRGGRVLDIGCGTGSYLSAQRDFFAGENFEWHGLDASAKMLERARGKLSGVELVVGRGESLPFDRDFFDYVTSRFTHHHFSDFSAVAGESFRVLKPGCVFTVFNLAPDLSPSWWLFRYFPEAVGIDTKRFLKGTQVTEVLSGAGFEVQFSTRKMDAVPASWILNEIANRETSELVLLSEVEYVSGRERAQAELSSLGEAMIDPGLCFGEWVARRPLTSETSL